MDYSKKESWNVEQLEQTLVFHTVLKPDELGDFERLWKAKLDCEKTMGCVMRPKCKHGVSVDRSCNACVNWLFDLHE